MSLHERPELPSYAALSNEHVRSELLELQAEGEDLGAVVRCLPLAGARKVLEIGCGTGALARAVARVLGPEAHVHGLDLSADHVSDARRIAREAGVDNVSFEVGDFMRYPCGADFDLVFCRYVLMYVIPRGEAQGFLARMRRCLRPGGRAACVEADINFGQERYPPPPPALAEVLERIVPYYREVGQIEWRAGVQLRHHLRQAGFSQVEVSLATGRLIQGGQPRSLVEHDAQDVEELIAPLLPPERRAAVSALWRRYLTDEGSFLYTPVFVGVGAGPAGSS